MAYFESEIADGIRPLSAREKAWIERLERVLLACPTERLELVTIGDPDLRVIDGPAAREIEICDGGAKRNGIQLAVMDGKCAIHATSG